MNNYKNDKITGKILKDLLKTSTPSFFSMFF